MAEDKKRRNLGRGLSALLGEESEDYAELDRLRVSKLVAIESVHPGRYQPRHKVDDESNRGLAQSIIEKGILQPLLVRRHPEKANEFEIIAGERRWRAAQLAKIHEVPVIIKDLTDQEALEVALVENLQRQDLTPLEEAEGYRQLMDEFSHTQEALAKVLGKSRSHVANMMRLLSLPQAVKGMLDSGALSAGHARALLNADDPTALANRVVKGDLNVRQTERLVQGKGPKPKARKPALPKDADTIALERDLETLLGLKVEITFRGRDGTLTLHYESLEQLDDILHRLSRGAFAGKAVEADDGPIIAHDGEALVELDIDPEDLPEESEEAVESKESLAADAVPVEDAPDVEEVAEAVEAALAEELSIDGTEPDAAAAPSDADNPKDVIADLETETFEDEAATGDAAEDVIAALEAELDKET